LGIRAEDKDQANTSFQSAGSHVSIQEERLLFVDSLQDGVTMAELKDAMDAVSTIIEAVDVPLHPATHTSFGHAFVTIRTTVDAQHAVEVLKDMKVRNRKAFVSLYDQTFVARRVKKMRKRVTKAAKEQELAVKFAQRLIEEEEGVDEDTASHSKANPASVMTKVQKQIVRQRFEDVCRRTPNIPTLENWVGEGKAIVLRVDCPSKKEVQGKNFDRGICCTAFYTHLLGEHLDHLFCALQNQEKQARDPIRILLAWPSSEEASLVKKRLKGTMFTVADYNFNVRAEKRPILKLDESAHRIKRSKSSAQPMPWKNMLGPAYRLWSTWVVATTELKLNAGQMSEQDLRAQEAGISEMTSQMNGSNASMLKQNVNDVRLPATFETENTAVSRPASDHAQSPLQTAPTQAPTAVIHDMEINELAYEPSDLALPPQPEFGDASLALQSQHGVELSAPGTIRSKLAQLTSLERELQQRYWGLTSDEELVRCSTCRIEGHMSETCPSLTCKNCNVFGEHFSSACPVAPAKCSKCGERGHSLGACPSKLKRTTAELECELCSEAGHVEDHCPFIWRTYHPEQIQNLRKITSMLMHCYGCGSKQHWGLDCPMRPQYLASFSNIFSAKEANRYLHAPPRNGTSNGFQIKGYASSDAILIDDDDDEYDEVEFLSSRIERAPVRGNIEMNLRSSNSSQNANLPARPPPPSAQEYSAIQNYSSYPPPRTYQRQRSRSPLTRGPQNNYRDRSDAPQQRRAFPPRPQEPRRQEQRGYQQGRGQAQRGRYQPRR
jgi:hypothetical protein